MLERDGGADICRKMGGIDQVAENDEMNRDADMPLERRQWRYVCSLKL